MSNNKTKINKMFVVIPVNMDNGKTELINNILFLSVGNISEEEKDNILSNLYMILEPFQKEERENKEIRKEELNRLSSFKEVLGGKRGTVLVKVPTNFGGGEFELTSDGERLFVSRIKECSGETLKILLTLRRNKTYLRVDSLSKERFPLAENPYSRDIEFLWRIVKTVINYQDQNKIDPGEKSPY